MTTPDGPTDDLGPEERALAARLEHERPAPSGGLRHRVLQRIRVALTQRMLRRRSVLLLSGGTVLLVLAVVLALSVPR